jgi:hypothetical protein
MKPTLPARGALALLVGVALAGCPLPQTLPEYPTTTPYPSPRIIAELAHPYLSLVRVGPSCAGGHAAFTLSATVGWENVTDPVDVRWFVDYDPNSTALKIPVSNERLVGTGDVAIGSLRPVKAWVFDPYASDLPGGSPADQQAFRDAGGLHVVELVVSNNFAPEPASPYPNRTPASSPRQFETQVYRWVFQYVPTGGSCSYP